MGCSSSKRLSVHSFLLQGLSPNDQSEVIKYTDACGGMIGTRQAIMTMAESNLMGLGAERNIEKGLYLLNYLADRTNDTGALLKLASLYENDGYYVPVDEHKAWSYYFRIIQERNAIENCNMERHSLFFSQASVQKWDELGGQELEHSIRSGALRLLDATWLVHHSVMAMKVPSYKGTISRRQDLPEEAFLPVDVVIASTKVSDIDFSKRVRIICLSYMWLDPSHPDPQGWTLGLLVRKLKEIIKNDLLNSQTCRWGIFWDFASLHQKPRNAEQEKLFRQGLDALSLLYSHPYTHVYKVTKFPPDYPKGYAVATLNESQHATNPYDRRGWTFTESCWANLTKSHAMTIDISSEEEQANGDNSAKPHDSAECGVHDIFEYLEASGVGDLSDDNDSTVSQDLYAFFFFRHFLGMRGGYEFLLEGLSPKQLVAFVNQYPRERLSIRQGPLHPDAFNNALVSRTFTNQKDDRTLVQQLYRSFFERRFGNAEELDYRFMCWKDDTITSFARLIQCGSTPKLQKIFLDANFTQARGGAAIAEAIIAQTSPHLTRLSLSFNIDFGDEGVAALSPCIPHLQWLSLTGVFMGPVGCQKLVESISNDDSSRLRELHVDNNPAIGNEGCIALSVIITQLEVLDISNCNVGNDGCRCLIEGVLSQSPTRLRRFDISENPLGDIGCKDMGKLVWHCKTTLRALGLRKTNISMETAAVLTEAFQCIPEDDHPFHGLKL